jgi:hypothetical protein
MDCVKSFRSVRYICKNWFRRISGRASVNASEVGFGSGDIMIIRRVATSEEIQLNKKDVDFDYRQSVASLAVTNGSHLLLSHAA